MSQINSGLRAILSIPSIYTSFQYIMGARQMWMCLVNDHLQIESNHYVLDIGCGPADILNYLPKSVNYWGYDISPEYIQKAKLTFGSRGHFVCKLLDGSDLNELPKFDRVILTGVFHHLDDETARNVVNLAYQALKDGGKMVSVDPCFSPEQSRVARFLISKDRGQNVRVEAAYKILVNKTFRKIKTNVVHKAWIPYTHCYMVCTK